KDLRQPVLGSARLHRLRGVVVLRADDRRRLSLTSKASRCRQALPRLRLPPDAGVVSDGSNHHRRRVGGLSTDDDLAWYGDRFARLAGVFRVEAASPTLG